MSIKKKVGMGVASAALGLSLVGGGTWAAFNDTATINNAFAAGTLDLIIKENSETEPINFDLSNMKPGDSVERVFKLTNGGSLAIKEVLLSAGATFAQGNGENDSEAEFLKQFTIDFFRVDQENHVYPDNKVSVFGSNGPISLYQLVNLSYDTNKIKDVYEATDGSKRINLAPLSNVVVDENRGIPTNGDIDEVHVKITFKNDTERINGDYSEFVQNKFMGNSATFQFNLEATQWGGVEVRTNDANGEVNNGVQGSADDTTNPTTQPDSRTTGTETINEEDVVED
ncbi:TasA family protein [Virgibacillus kekensis]|uniref:TasA family protein n=1 Tax=Virgibacillus kekensis TaxID=202261 RepID=A0ABV9DFL6_9BACI